MKYKIFTTFLLQIIFTLLIISLSTTVKAKSNTFNHPFDLPIKANTNFYLTATPNNHSVDGNRAAIDIQIINELGFIEKGIPLYSPIDGYAEYIVSPNGTAVLEIISHDKQWKLVIAHIANDVKQAKNLLDTYPKHVIKDELIAYQGDSGYFTNGATFPVHVHFEVFKLVNDEYVNDNSQIDICSKIRLKQHCERIDDSGFVLFIYDK